MPGPPMSNSDAGRLGTTGWQPQLSGVNSEPRNPATAAQPLPPMSSPTSSTGADSDPSAAGQDSARRSSSSSLAPPAKRLSGVSRSLTELIENAKSRPTVWRKQVAEAPSEWATLTSSAGKGQGLVYEWVTVFLVGLILFVYMVFAAFVLPSGWSGRPNDSHGDFLFCFSTPIFTFFCPFMVTFNDFGQPWTRAWWAKALNLFFKWWVPWIISPFLIITILIGSTTSDVFGSTELRSKIGCSRMLVVLLLGMSSCVLTLAPWAYQRALIFIGQTSEGEQQWTRGERRLLAFAILLFLAFSIVGVVVAAIDGAFGHRIPGAVLVRPLLIFSCKFVIKMIPTACSKLGYCSAQLVHFGIGYYFLLLSVFQVKSLLVCNTFLSAGIFLLVDWISCAVKLWCYSGAHTHNAGARWARKWLLYGHLRVDGTCLLTSGELRGWMLILESKLNTAVHVGLAALFILVQLIGQGSAELHAVSTAFFQSEYSGIFLATSCVSELVQDGLIARAVQLWSGKKFNKWFSDPKHIRYILLISLAGAWQVSTLVSYSVALWEIGSSSSVAIAQTEKVYEKMQPPLLL